MEKYTEIEIRTGITLNEKQMKELEGYYEEAKQMGYSHSLNSFCNFIFSCGANNHLLENAKYIIEHDRRIKDSQ